jgi:hypothetical protein
VAAAGAWVVSALLALTSDTFATGAALELVTVADDCVAVATALTAPAEVVGDDGVVVALTVAECFEFDSVLGLDVVCSVSGAGFGAGVLRRLGSEASPAAGSLDFGCVSTSLAPFGNASESVVPACASPLLLTVTPAATWADEDVAPDDFVALVGVEPLLLDVDPPAVDGEPAADPLDDSPDDVLLGVEFAELVEDDSEEVPVVSAAANP